jgi:hypothetical protein
MTWSQDAKTPSHLATDSPACYRYVVSPVQNPVTVWNAGGPYPSKGMGSGRLVSITNAQEEAEEPLHIIGLEEGGDRKGRKSLQKNEGNEPNFPPNQKLELRSTQSSPERGGVPLKEERQVGSTCFAVP